MKTSFAEIDDLVSDVCEREIRSPSVERGDDLKLKATRVIAGFHLYDKAEEDRLYEAALKSRVAGVGRFQKARDDAMTLCAANGVTPLAIVPSAAWVDICNATKLFRFAPDSAGRVGLSTAEIDKLVDVKDTRTRRTITAGDQLEYLARTDWPSYLLMLFPTRESLPVGKAPDGWVYQTLLTQLMSGASVAMLPPTATLVLPMPPADIAQTLLKMDSRVPLKVAAVADAVAFKETPSEIMRNVVAAREAIERQLREDPIVYYDGGIATAIIAQFGDFPIEKEVVQRVLSAQTALRFFPGNVKL